MRSFEELIELLISSGVKISSENGKLKYNAPAGVVNIELIAELKTHKNELLGFINSKEKDKINPYPGKELVSLSFAQNRLWFLDKLEEDSFAYNLPFPVKIEGYVNLDALKTALIFILNRHTILRTSFPEKDGIPYQKVNELPDNVILHLNTPGNSVIEKWDWIKNRIAGLVKVPFNLAEGPLYNLQIYDIAENTHVLFIMFHHIILDGWSIDIMIKEIGECYKSLASGNEVTLPQLKIQYSDFSIWHNQWMESPHAKMQLSFWKKKLAEAPVLLQMPLVRPRPSVQTLNGATETFFIEDELFAGIKKLASENGCSLFMLMYAAFSVLLYRYSHQDDIIIGTTIANRNRAEIEPLLGLFANTILLRADLSGNPTFKNLLARIKDKTLHAYANQDIPFEKIVEEVKPERSLNHTPLFQILFELQHITDNKDSHHDLVMSAIESENVSAKFDMNFLLLVKNGSLVGSLEFNSDLFDISYILRMIGHYKKILRQVISNVFVNIDTADYITGEEKEVIKNWNNTNTDFPVDKTFDNLFLESVKKYPHNTAAVENNISITYSELNKRSEMLASELIACGAGPEKVVAILSERGIKYLISVLAVFKCGAAFLPLDPYHPASRHSHIIEQSNPVIILSENKFTGIIEEAVTSAKINNINRIYVDDLLERNLENINCEFPVSTPDNLAYIIFTSGSTGKPKGAMVLQKGMVNHLCSKIKDLNIISGSYIAQNASQCFDISVWQYLAALLVGGKIEIFPDEIAHDAEKLIYKIDKNNITILEVVPSFMSVMIDMLETKTGYLFNSLKWLVPTGETLFPPLAVKWLQHFPNIPLINAYGPTECSDDVTHFPVHKIEDINTASVPIGKPIANTQILILDKNQQPVPVGITGELYVAGVCVGRGYINDELKTNEVFVPHPFKPDEIIYRSGDLARYLSDGNIEFLGRIDSQVKVRGFRIELGEIENELRKYENIKDAVVMVRNEGKNLIGYIVAEPKSIINSADILVFLKNSLPEYMVPSRIIILDSLPLTSNGKINRNALPEPDLLFEEEIITLPETGTELIVCTIWKELLRLDQIGINQNFFVIGGHSLLATRLVTKIRDRFLIELSLKSIFEKTTIKDLSSYIDTLLWLRENQFSNETENMDNIII